MTAAIGIMEVIIPGVVQQEGSRQSSVIVTYLAKRIK